MRDLKVEKQLWEKERDTWTKDKESKDERYQELDKYDKFLSENPSIFREIQNQYYQKGSLERKDTGNQMIQYPGQKDSVLSSLQTQIQSLQDRITKDDERNAVKDEADKELKLETSIGDYKDKYSYINWKDKNDRELNLEQQILTYAIDNGIKSFKAAANDYLFDKHLAHAKLSAGEKAVSKIRNQQKLGLGSITKEPTREIKQAKKYNSSYDAAIADIADEYGIDL